MYDWLNNPATIDPTFSHLPLSEQQAILATLQAAKDASTTTSPIATGSKKASTVIESALTPSMFAMFKNVKRPRRLTLAEEIAAEVAQCSGCTGDCLKKTNRLYVPTLSVEDGKEVVRQCRCKFGKQRDMVRKVCSSRIPDRYIGKTLEDYACDAHNRNAVEYAKQASKLNCGAYFYGECGTGKTFLASIIAQDFLRNGAGVLFVKVPSLLDDIKATFGGQGSELAILDELRAATLVVLDDFGMENILQPAQD